MDAKLCLQSVGNVLRQCYHDPAAVTDELVDCILKPGLLPGAVDVFLDFISYVGGPLPEELLEVGRRQQQLQGSYFLLCFGCVCDIPDASALPFVVRKAQVATWRLVCREARCSGAGLGSALCWCWRLTSSGCQAYTVTPEASP